MPPRILAAEATDAAVEPTTRRDAMLDNFIMMLLQCSINCGNFIINNLVSILGEVLVSNCV